MNLFALLLCLTVGYTASKRFVNIVTNNPECTKLARFHINQYPTITTIELFIITSVCEGIVHPMDSGLGGGFQMVLHENHKSDQAIYINAREKSGEKHTFPKLPGTDPRHIGVPSMLAGYQYIYNNIQKLGYPKGPALTWPKLFQKNIELGENGFERSRTLNDVLHYIDEDLGLWNKIGTRMNSPNLGNYLRKIAKYGSNGQEIYINNTYDNRLMIRELEKAGSPLTRNDLINYRVQEKPAQTATCMGYRLFTSQLPGSGFLQLFGCKIYESAINRFGYFHWRQNTKFLFNIRVLYYLYSLQPHLLYLEEKSNIIDQRREKLIKKMEAKKLTRKELRYIKMQSPMRLLIDRDAALIASYIINHFNGPIPLKVTNIFGRTRVLKSHILKSRTIEHGTSNICISDNITNLCATSTINWSFGSGLVSEYFGFFYNNQLSDFTYENKLNYNRPRPNAYPQSSIAPTIVTNAETGQFEFSVGAAGGRKIVSSIFSVLINMVNQRGLADKEGTNYNCKMAVEVPRCIFHLKPAESEIWTFLECETSLSQTEKNILKAHRALVRYSTEVGYGSVTSVTKNMAGCPDPRRGGEGYMQNG